MRDDTGLAVFYTAICGLVICITASAISYSVGRSDGYIQGRDQERKAAIKAGVAEWRADGDGSPEFYYIGGK
jgi:hypothetical protein